MEVRIDGIPEAELSPEDLDLCRNLGAVWITRDRRRRASAVLWIDLPSVSSCGEWYARRRIRVAAVDGPRFPKVPPGGIRAVPRDSMEGSDAGADNTQPKMIY